MNRVTQAQGGGGEGEERGFTIPALDDGIKQKPKPVIADVLAGLQARVEITEKTKEELKLKKNKTLIEWIFGQNNAISTFISGITGWLARATGWGNKEVPWDKFQEELAKQGKEAEAKPFNLEEFVVAHRSLGYGRHKENSLEAIEAAVAGGEKQIEIDLRMGKDGEIYLAHDPIPGDDSLDKYTKLDDTLAFLAKHPDVVILFDIKEKAALSKMDEKIAVYDRRFPNSKLKDRHFVVAFDDELAKEASEKKPDRPVIFAYVPLVRLEGMSDVFQKMKNQEFQALCRQVDQLTGGSVKLADNFDETSLRINGQKVEGGNHTNYRNVLNVYNELPPENILAGITHIAIPALLATPQLVQKAHDKGLKVVVFGVEGKALQQAIVDLKPDLVVSDNPDMIKSKPVEVDNAKLEAAA
ncbi:glycerophosphodiester phosphodiesterase [Candidatus Peregrinibacteria bacterium]|nr:glycerophosphodiester phosphodiesterase [Candidatus Peregrinibacteria bacterium]